MQNATTQTTRATELLRVEHDAVRDLIARLRNSAAANAGKKRDLVVELGAAIRAHVRLERDVFYPGVVEAAGPEEGVKLLADALAEHDRAVSALERLEVVDLTSMGFRRAVRALSDAIDDHANNEESLVFPRIKRLVDGGKLNALAARMQTLRPAPSVTQEAIARLSG